MRRDLLLSVVLVCLICFGALGGVIVAGWSPKLGLDLEGGLSVVFTPAQKATPAQLQTVVAIMQLRASGIGVSSPNIGTQGNNIVVQLPGVKNFSKVIGEIGNTAQLSFRPVLCAANAYTPAPSKTKTTTTTTVPKKATTTTTTVPKTKKKTKAAAYTKPPACGAYLFTTAT